MLHRYAFSNFHSFLEHTEVSLTLNGKVPRTNWERDASFGAERLSTVMAIIGPNGAGKTNMLRPLLFLAHFMASSFSDEPDGPIALLEPHFSTPDQASNFEFEFSHAPLGGEARLYRYELSATRQKVLREALFEKRFGRLSYIFMRDWNPSTLDYAVKHQVVGFSLGQTKLRPNASLLSTAAQWGAAPLADLSRLLRCDIRMATAGMSLLTHASLEDAAAHFNNEKVQQTNMKQLLSSWDLGLQDIAIVPLRQQQPDGSTQERWYPVGEHRARSNQGLDSHDRIHYLPLARESSGTQAAFVLLKPLLNALRYGHLAIVDELELGLHPHMLEPILSLFADPTVNIQGAQLLFTTHSMQVLNLLHKSRVMLTEKNEYGESAAWRLDSVKGIRNDDNLYAKYMTGAYGAVPQL